ncbi:DUF3024 domain-containing protein [Microbacterium pseudoresistens]|uniref:DUF3024 domain-containing protein n=1 Tax=Microbacterium pseudoresistens TaxID=640634 RepID=UPI001FE902E7|nr:DUF3024 domain-containing protein [Microbacterium pseudoresistens]
MTRLRCQRSRARSARSSVNDVLKPDTSVSAKCPESRHSLRASRGSGVECEIADGHVTIFEARPPWDGGGDWIRTPIVRLRYVGTTGQWSIYWADRHSRFHEYTRKRPTKRVQTLLDYIGSGADPIFWG